MSTDKTRITLPIIRLVSGLIVMFYAFGHLLNHALGLISIEAMEQGRVLFSNIWRSPLLYWVVPVALLAHIVTAVWTLLAKKTLKKMSKGDIFQTALGFIIPFMLFQHITGTRYVYHQFGVEASYTKYFYIASNHPEMGETGPMVMKILLSVMVVFVWYHSCMGMDKWLRLKEWYKKIWSYWFSLAILTPVLSILGFIVGFKEYSMRTESDYFPLLDQMLVKHQDQLAAYCETVKPAVITAGLTDGEWTVNAPRSLTTPALHHRYG